MRSTKSIILIVIALGCGLIASIGISQVMDKDVEKEVAETEMIFVAKSNVPSWSKLTAEHVVKEEWPKDNIPEGAAKSLEDLEGKSPRYPLYPGEPIILTKLSDESGQYASIRIPAGHQVFAVKVDRESALSGLISPGDKVDVLVFIRGRKGLPTSSRTILRNTTVFAVNAQIDRRGEDSRIDAKTVSLLVTPEQSERLLLAKQLGTIHLALRKPGDQTKIETSGAVPRDLNQAEDGSDKPTTTTSTSDTNQKNDNNGIFTLLKKMEATPNKAVDTIKAPQAAGPQMVIMTPDGILGTYTFPSGHTGTGLPALPNELLDEAEPPIENESEEIEELEIEVNPDGTTEGGFEPPPGEGENLEEIAEQLGL